MKKLILSSFLIFAFSIIGASQSQAAVLFFEAPGSDGYDPWNHPVNINAFDAWKVAIGETPDFKEDWDGLDWKGDPWANETLFDIQDVPTAIFVDGVTFANTGASASRRAKTDDSPGGTDAIGTYSWQAHESGTATVDFSAFGTDYLGFWISDTDDDITYRITLSDSTTVSFDGLETDEDHYRFVGFFNNMAGMSIHKLEIIADDSSRYGIDEFQWGRVNTTTTVIPEPSTVLLFGLGLAGLAWTRFRK